MVKTKRTNNDLQIITNKTKDGATRTSQKPANVRCSEGEAFPTKTTASIFL
jgi:hypothetical protein